MAICTLFADFELPLLMYARKQKQDTLKKIYTYIRLHAAIFELNELNLDFDQCNAFLFKTSLDSRSYKLFKQK